MPRDVPKLIRSLRERRRTEVAPSSVDHFDKLGLNGTVLGVEGFVHPSERIRKNLQGEALVDMADFSSPVQNEAAFQRFDSCTVLRCLHGDKHVVVNSGIPTR